MQDSIEKVIELKAPVGRVWRAVTDHREFGDWFRVDLDGPFRPGELSTGKVTYPGYEHLKWEVRVLAMEPERLFSYRWSPYSEGPEAGALVGPTTLVEFRLEAIEGGTRLTITESGFAALPADPRRDVALRTNTEGWNQQAENITRHVEAPRSEA